MARVRGKDTRPELFVRSALHAAGLRFRLHRRDLPGSPDIVLPKHQVVVFVNGCFWHGHDCKRGTRPSSNTDFWSGKIDGNIARDKRSMEALSAEGWRVIVIWECRLKVDTDDLIDSLTSVSERGASQSS